MSERLNQTADKMSDEKLESTLKPYIEKVTRFSKLAKGSIVIAALGLLGFVVLNMKPAIAVS